MKDEGEYWEVEFTFPEDENSYYYLLRYKGDVEDLTPDENIRIGSLWLHQDAELIVVWWIKSKATKPLPMCVCSVLIIEPLLRKSQFAMDRQRGFFFAKKMMVIHFIERSIFANIINNGLMIRNPYNAVVSGMIY